jgi:hypothetical protein
MQAMFEIICCMLAIMGTLLQALSRLEMQA